MGAASWQREVECTLHSTVGCCWRGGCASASRGSHLAQHPAIGVLCFKAGPVLYFGQGFVVCTLDCLSLRRPGSTCPLFLSLSRWQELERALTASLEAVGSELQRSVVRSGREWKPYRQVWHCISPRGGGAELHHTYARTALPYIHMHYSRLIAFALAIAFIKLTDIVLRNCALCPKHAQTALSCPLC